MPWVYRMTVLLSVGVLPVYIYVGFRLSSAIETATASGRFPISKKSARRTVFAVVAWLYLFPAILLFYHLGGTFNRLFVFEPHLQWQDYLLLYPFWWGVISLLEIFPFFAVLDIIGGLSRLKIFSGNPDKKPLRKKKTAYLKIGITIFFLFYVGIRSYIDTTHLRISTSTVTLEDLPEKLQGLQLCLFGDMHLDRYTREQKTDKLKETLSKGDNDLIVFTGDLISRGTSYIDQALHTVCNPRARIAGIACMGDHDYWSAAQDIPDELEKCGWIFLENRHRLFPYKGYRILVTGITHVYSRQISKSSLDILLGNAPDADLKILIVHQPMEGLIKIAAQQGYHLLLAGHTHGGQIVNHIFGFPVSAGQEETRFCWGIHQVDGMKVVVTNGIGLTLAALRYHAPAEITKLILKKK